MSLVVPQLEGRRGPEAAVPGDEGVLPRGRALRPVGREVAARARDEEAVFA